MCRVLGVSPSGYYAWLKRTPSKRTIENAWLTNRIHEIHEESMGTYGAPRIHAELLGEGENVGLNRVARLMRDAGLQGVSRRRETVTTLKGEDSRPVPDVTPGS
jgi:putative transposase